MFLKDKEIQIKVHSNNLKHYKSIFGEHIQINDLLFITQKDLPLTGRTKVECKCDICEISFLRMRKDVKENTLCSLKCRNEFFGKGYTNPNPKKEKIKVKCQKCEKEHFIHLSVFKKQERFFCSKECYHTAYLFKNIKETKIEKSVREYLEEKNIVFEKQKGILTYLVDFYIPSLNLVLETYGDYWHVNPKLYGKGKKEIDKKLLGKNEKDKLRNEKITNEGYNVEIVWEYDVKHNLIETMDNLLNKYTQRSVTTGC